MKRALSNVQNLVALADDDAKWASTAAELLDHLREDIDNASKVARRMVPKSEN